MTFKKAYLTESLTELISLFFLVANRSRVSQIKICNILYFMFFFVVSPLHKTTENFKLNNQDLIQVQIFKINSRGFYKLQPSVLYSPPFSGAQKHLGN